MARHQIETNIEIDAPAARVWALLTDFSAMPAWNPFIRSISGDLAQGARLSVQIAPPGRSGARFNPTVLAPSGSSAGSAACSFQAFSTASTIFYSILWARRAPA